MRTSFSKFIPNRNMITEHFKRENGPKAAKAMLLQIKIHVVSSDFEDQPVIADLYTYLRDIYKGICEETLKKREDAIKYVIPASVAESNTAMMVDLLKKFAGFPEKLATVKEYVERVNEMYHAIAGLYFSVIEELSLERDLELQVEDKEKIQERLRKQKIWTAQQEKAA